MIKISEYNPIAASTINTQMYCLKNWNLPSKRKQAIELGEALRRVDNRMGFNITMQHGIYQLKETIVSTTKSIK